MELRYITFSECGKRPNNQDYIQVVQTLDGGRTAFIVCDGMGGHAMGDVASQTVANSIANYWEKNPKRKDSAKKVIDACHQASVAIDKRADQLHHVEMGTTLVLASIEDDTVTIAHCGDSRCYLIRPNESIVYQTKDHVAFSFGWEFVAKCFFSYRQEVADPDVQQCDIKSGDMLFLCTDGVFKCMSDEELTEMLRSDKDIESIADDIKLMCKKQSNDNYSGILIKID